MLPKDINNARALNKTIRKIKNHIFDGAATQVIGTLSNRKEIKVELRKGSEDFKNRETVYLNYQTEDLIVLKGDSHEKV